MTNENTAEILNHPARTEAPIPNDAVAQIYAWFEKAVPNPASKNIHTQLGVHFEEVGEMVTALQEAGADYGIREQFDFYRQVVDHFQKQLKSSSGDGLVNLDEVNRIELLDALCDQIVTAIGVGYMLNFDMNSALKEVANSNDSKFDRDGQPIFNEAKKIMKGPTYFKPDLARFI